MTETTDRDTGTKRSRRRRVRLVVLASVIAALTLGGLTFWNSRPETDERRLVYVKTLPDGRVFRCYTDGAVIGSPGTEVSQRDAPPGPEGSEGGPAYVVRPPDYTEDDARQAAEEYEKSGRSFERDVADFERLSAECRERR